MASLKAFLPLAIMYGSKQVIDFEDESIIPLLRLFFGGSTILIFVIYAFLWWKIGKSGDEETMLNCKKKDLDPPNPLGVEAEGGDEDISMTYQAYDMKELYKLVKASAMQSAIVGVMHFKFEYIQPLLMTSIMSMVNMFDSNLIKVYVLGQELDRPFTQTPSPFAALLNPGGDAAAEEEDNTAGEKTSKSKKKEKKKDR